MSGALRLVGSLLVLLSTLVAADDLRSVPPRFPQPRITQEQWVAFEAEVEATPDVECRYLKALQYQCFLGPHGQNPSSHATMWIFTRPGHPAHPACSRGILFLEPHRAAMDRSSYYAGDYEAFKTWAAEFHRLDERELDEIRKSTAR